MPPFSCSRSVLIVAVLAPLAICVVAAAHGEPVIGQFELKTLDSEAGAVEFQSQNAWSWGQPRRRIATDDAGELVFDENTVIPQRHALEVEAGFTSFLKMRAGVEFEKERIDDPTTIGEADSFEALELTEIGLELIAILKTRHGDGTGFGLVVELERPLDDDEPETLILGTVIEYRLGPWFAAAVPMAARTSGGRTEDDERIDDKWDFAYAAQLTYELAERWSVALEGYGTVERVSESGNPSESAQRFSDFDQHRAGIVVYHTYEFGEHAQASTSSLRESRRAESTGLTIGVGLLAGLNDHTPDTTLKLSIELDF